jgi:hypothetical protein
MTDADRLALSAAMDRLIPPVDALPGAGTLGLLAEVESMATRHPRFRDLLPAFRALLPADFAALPRPAQDAALHTIEQAQPPLFREMLDVTYLAYYADPRVHARIGWRSGPLQPAGFPLPPFDETVLATARRRAPFWRPA